MPRPNAARLGSILFSILLLFGMEAASRWYLSTRTPGDPLWQIHKLLKPEPDLFWAQRSNQDLEFFGARVRTDEFGFRNPPQTVEKRDPNEYRILVLGASPSFGWGVEGQDTYPRLLEEILRSRLKRPIRVVNASVIGYSSFQGLRLFQRVVERFRPDHVIVAFGINDVSRERFFFSGRAEDKNLRISPFALEVGGRLAELALSQLIAKASGNIGPSRRPGAIPPIRVSLDDLKANYRNIASIARSHGSSVSFLNIPFRFPRDEEHAPAFNEMHEAETLSRTYFQEVIKLGREMAIPVTDMTRPLYADYRNYYLVSRHDYIHPNPKGHARIAQRLADELTPIIEAKREALDPR